MKRAITGIVAASLTLGTMAPAAFAATASAPSYFGSQIHVGSYNTNVQALKVQDAGNTTALFPFYYIQSGLNSIGYTVTWDGVAKKLSITTPAGVTLDTSKVGDPGVGAVGIYINGVLVQRAPFSVANDKGGNNKPTSFMSTYYLDKALALVGFTNSYNGTGSGWTLTAPVAQFEVAGVMAVNAKTVNVTFSKPVAPNTVIDSTTGQLKAGVFSFTGIDSAPGVVADNATGSLSSDGKTLTITAAGATAFQGSYALTITTAVTDTAGNALPAYSGIVTDNDTTRPTVSGPVYSLNNQATFTFSEPVNLADDTALAGVVSIHDETGAPVSASGLVHLSADKTSFTLDTTGWHTGKTYTVTLVGAADFAGNLITPNPVTFNVINSTVDTTAPTITKVVATHSGQVQVTFSEKLGTLGSYKVGASTVSIDTTPGSGNASWDSTGTVLTINDTTNFAAGIASVTFTGYKDLSGNLGTDVTKLLQFSDDITSPTVTSSSVQTISGTQYLVVNFSEPVQVGSATTVLGGSYVDSNQVTHSWAGLANAKESIYDPSNASATSGTAVKIDLTNLTVGNYSATLALDAVEDLSAAHNQLAATPVTFAVGTVADTTKPTASIVQLADVQPSEDVVNVHFDRDVTAATALNVNNYLVEGQAVFTKAIFNGDQHTVQLTLKPGAVTVTGNRTVTIQNVVGTNGVAMNSFSNVYSFQENVKPVVTSAQLTGASTITVTFSKSMNASTLIDNGDFTVTVGGSTVAIDSVAGSGSTYTLTLHSAVTDLSQPVVLSVKAGNNVVDSDTVANTLATTGTVTVTH